MIAASTLMAPKLKSSAVEKPWDREDLPPLFPNPEQRKIGAIWFEASEASALPLLFKYRLTSERLSIQVHPDNARARGYDRARGTEQCGESRILLQPTNASFHVDILSWRTGKPVRRARAGRSWLIRLKGSGTVGERQFRPGDCVFIEPAELIPDRDERNAVVVASGELSA